MHDVDWFAMESLKKSRLVTASWVPLFQRLTIEELEFPEIGNWEEYIDCYSAVFSLDQENLLGEIQWMDIFVDTGHRPSVDGDLYLPARDFHQWSDDIHGEYLVLLNKTLEGIDVLIEPDLICAFGLIKEGDAWLCPNEDFTPVIRQKRNPKGDVNLVEVRGPHLRDYLCARNSQLVVASYRSRSEIFAKQPDFVVPEKIDKDGMFFECGMGELDESGSPFGQRVSTLIVGRTDVDPDDDVPVLEFPKDGDTWSESHEFTRESGKRFRIVSEMWKNEIVPPSSSSPRVRGDDVEPDVDFIVDNDGGTEKAKQLKLPPSKWLWFSPNLIKTILDKRGTWLNWYSADTGGIGLLGQGEVHFGVNIEGVINIYAKDVGMLPVWWQKVFASHNQAPDGKVASELMAAQMQSRPAPTIAPEVRLRKSVENVNRAFEAKFGHRLFRDHESEDILWRHANRFAASDEQELFKLTKNLVRLCIERFDGDLLKTLTPTADKALGSIKRLGLIISDAGGDGRALTGVLVGINELRQRDSHLPSSEDLDHAYKLAQIDENHSFQQKAKSAIGNLATCLDGIAELF